MCIFNLHIIIHIYYDKQMVMMDHHCAIQLAHSNRWWWPSTTYWSNCVCVCEHLFKINNINESTLFQLLLLLLLLLWFCNVQSIPQVTSNNRVIAQCVLAQFNIKTWREYEQSISVCLSLKWSRFFWKFEQKKKPVRCVTWYEMQSLNWE